MLSASESAEGHPRPKTFLPLTSGTSHKDLWLRHGQAERFLTKRNRRILFMLTLVVAVVATVDAFCDLFPLPLSIVLYVLAAAGFVMTCTLLVKAISLFISSVVLPFAGSNRIADALITDSRLRTVLTVLPGMGLNLIYAVFTGVVGITAHSAWYGSLCAYYILLCVMRFLAVSYAKQIYTGKEQGAGQKAV